MEEVAAGFQSNIPKSRGKELPTHTFLYMASKVSTQ